MNLPSEGREEIEGGREVVEASVSSAGAEDGADGVSSLIGVIEEGRGVVLIHFNVFCDLSIFGNE